MSFDYLARGVDAVDAGRSRLRAYVLVSEVVDAMKRLAVKQEAEARADSRLQRWHAWSL